MNRLADIVIMSRRAKNNATVYMPERYAAIEGRIIRKELSKFAKYVCFDIF